MKTIIVILLFIVPSFLGDISSLKNQISVSNQSEVPVKNVFLKYRDEFSAKEDLVNFYFSNYHVFVDCKTQKININKGGEQVGSVNIYKQYDGPGFRIYLFGDVADNYHVIVIEALADIGTAWYSVILLGKKKIVNQCFINNPRANSDICNIKDFMKILISNDYCEIQLDIKNIARYSYIPKALRTDSNFVYITMPIIGSKRSNKCYKVSEN